MADQTLDPDFKYVEGDYSFGPQPPDAGFMVDVDDDGETTAQVKNGVWVSDDQDLADYLNLRASELNITDSQTLASDACDLFDCGMKAL